MQEKAIYSTYNLFTPDILVFENQESKMRFYNGRSKISINKFSTIL